MEAKTSGKYQTFSLAILLILKKNTNSGKQLRTILRWISEAAQAAVFQAGSAAADIADSSPAFRRRSSISIL